MMTCRNCGNQNAHHIRTVFDDDGPIDLCDSSKCGNLDMAGAGIPDVYLPRGGMKFENLCDDMGRPYEITSKRQKAEIMRRLGVQEAGDSVNGAPYGSKSWTEGSREYRKRNFEQDRQHIRETYKRYLENVRKGQK